METYRTYQDITSEISSLREDVFVEEQNIPYVLEIEKTENLYLHFCLLDNQKLIAYARGRIEGRIAHIGRVCVQRTYRDLGYGRKIMKYAEAELSSKIVEEYQLNAQNTAKEFYEKLGYQVKGKAFMEAGILHYPMKKVRKK